jgi:hypothetical protein
MPELNAAGPHPISADGIISIEDKARVAASIDIDPERMENFCGLRAIYNCALQADANCL